MRYCPKCKQEKDELEFSSIKAYSCRACVKAYDDARKAKRKEYFEQYREQNKDKRLEYSRQYNVEHREEKRVKSLRYYYDNKDKIKEYSREYYAENKEKQIEAKRKFRQNNLDYVREQQRQWYENNRDKVLAKNRTPQVNLERKVAKQLADFIHTRNIDILKLLPFSSTEFILDFASKFTSEMTWDNYGKYWEIDHIIPKRQFNYVSINDHDFKICWSLMNLRPLTIFNNRSRPKDGSDVPKELKQAILDQEV